MSAPLPSREQPVTASFFRLIFACGESSRASMMRLTPQTHAVIADADASAPYKSKKRPLPRLVRSFCRPTASFVKMSVATWLCITIHQFLCKEYMINACCAHSCGNRNTQPVICDQQRKSSSRRITFREGDGRAKRDSLVPKSSGDTECTSRPVLSEVRSDDRRSRREEASLVALDQRGDLCSSACPVLGCPDGSSVVEHEGIGEGGLVESGNGSRGRACYDEEMLVSGI